MLLCAKKYVIQDDLYPKEFTTWKILSFIVFDNIFLDVSWSTGYHRVSPYRKSSYAFKFRWHGIKSIAIRGEFIQVT